MDVRRTIRQLKTPITLLLLAAFVFFAAQWGMRALQKPIPPRPPEPCTVQQVGDTLMPEHIDVNVLNGSPNNGVARRLGSILSADGFKVRRRVNADRQDYPTSLVVGNATDSPEVKVVAQAFDGIELRADGRVDHSVDVIIGVEQPTVKQKPTFGVPLEDGTACLPPLRSGSSTEG